MIKKSRKQRRLAALEKELLAAAKKEEKLKAAAVDQNVPGWKQKLTDKIPEKVCLSLEAAFGKAFGIVFEKGTAVIEKTYNRQKIEEDYQIRDFSVQIKGGRKQIKSFGKSVRSANLCNLIFTTAEGIGLGALGIGMPDIVMFTGVLLKGIYETALRYGYDYETPSERMLILKMMEASLAKGEEWILLNAEVDSLLEAEALPETAEAAIGEQIKKTARAFAMDMLLLKFIQGAPVIGIFGGVGNPVYYSRVMEYVKVKYQKRYLLGQMRAQEALTADICVR